MLCIGTAMFGMFFFLTIFVQDVLGYSALKTGVAYLPMIAADHGDGRGQRPAGARIGARPLLLAGAAVSAAACSGCPASASTATYASGLLGPTLVTAAGLGLLFVPLSLVALTRVRDQDAGLASSLLNTGQQVGGSIGLAVLGTVAWTAVANSAQPAPRRPPWPRPGPAIRCTGPPRRSRPRSTTTRWRPGSPAGSMCRPGIMLAALVIAAIVAIRVTGARTSPAPPRPPRGSRPALSPLWSQPIHSGSRRSRIC